MSKPHPGPKGVLLCPPTYYGIAKPRNPHTLDPDGRLWHVDREESMTQWRALRDAFRSIGLQVDTVAPEPGLLDQVFTANPVFAYRRGRERVFLASRMRYPERAGEVTALAHHLEEAGYTRIDVPEDVGVLEGGGDLVPSVDGDRIFGGHAIRSTLAAVEWAGETLGTQVVPLRLVDKRFYHLDTCLAVLDAETCITHLPAFDATGQEAIKEAFPTRLELDEAGAMRMAANAYCPDGKHVFIESECKRTQAWLTAQGFVPLPVPTSQFRRSGGSVYCLKQSLW